MRRRVKVACLVLGLTLVAVACNPPASHVPGAPNCPLSPATSYWRADVSKLPVLAKSPTYVASEGATAGLKADFGSGLWDGGPIGIPFTTVPGTQPKVAMTFDYADESNPGPYPFPANAPIEGGATATGDRHVLVVDRDACKLYETWDSHPNADGSWHTGSGAVFDLTSNALRPAGWTSADAAGLPILPGLVRYDEVAGGTIRHAIRMTVPHTQQAYLWPARHQAGESTNANLPHMGEWFRLKASVDPAGFDPAVRPIIVALQQYGAIIADNGLPWFLSGAPDARWNNDLLATLGRIKGSDFEAVDTRSLIVNANSGQATTAS
ncbi:MAG TPA: hypothetical protein VIJ47_07980 [Acidimicrobiales bacterium]